MFFQNEYATIDITKIYGERCPLEKTAYDLVYNIKDIDEEDIFGIMKIKVSTKSHQYTVALLGFYLSGEDNAILEEDILTILMNNVVIKLNLQTGKILSSVQFELFGTGDGIYKIDGGYILRGEAEIIRLNKDLNVIWRFSGRDIFYLPSGEESFVMCDDSIKLYDFLGYFYEIDYDGNPIREIPPIRR